jgi:hypothetical protein
VQLGVVGLSVGELVLENDDAARRFERCAAIHQFADPCRDPQLLAGVTAVPTLRTLRCNQFRLIEASQKSCRRTENPRGTAHAVSRVTFVVEPLVGSSLGQILRFATSPFTATPPQE